MMDPEPGRCRRTDGKKWRCRKSVVADQKYCERHMHRGRQRSRKLVENSETVLRSDHPIVNKNSSLPSVNSSNAINSNNKINVFTPIGSGLSYTVPNANKSAPAAVYITSASPTSEKKASSSNIVNLSATSATIICCDSENEGNCKFKVDTCNSNASSAMSSSIKAACTNEMTGSRIKHIKGEVVDFNNNKVRIISCSNHGKEGCPAKFHGPVYGLSPKSVLQGVTDARCSLLSSNQKNVTETELQRCRRTDGKKWRCTRSVVHGQKYCVTRMHRGVKKVAGVPNLTTIDSAVPSTSHGSQFFVARRINSRINLNIDPSTSIAACPQPLVEDDSITSCSSDATTITN